MLLESSKERTVEFQCSWYWNFSHSDCGIKSNYMSMINVACYGATTTFHDPFNTFIINSVNLRRDIEEILYRIDFKYQKILFASFADVRLDPQIEMIFSKYTGAAYCTKLCNIDELEKLCRDFHQGRSSNKDKELISQIRIEATANYQTAIELYIQSKRKSRKPKSGATKNVKTKIR